MTVFIIDPTLTAGSDFPYDASSNARTLTLVSTTTSVGDNPKFGYGSISFVAPGISSSAAITAPDAADWLFSGPFTVESWINLQSTSGGSGGQVIVCQGQASTSGLSWALLLNTAQTALQFQYSTSGTAWTVLSGAKTFALNTWYHVAVDRDAGGVIRIYVDGVMLNSVTMASSLSDSTLALCLGNYGNSGSTGRLPGWIEELRITNGTARYASDAGYTVPGAEFPSNGSGDPYWANVKLLLRGPGGRTAKGAFRSFAALTTARCNPGDSVRMPASPLPTLAGSAAWANNSRFVTLDTAKTVNIDTCETTWTAVSANVSQAVNFTARKHGNNNLQISIGSAFTTGKLAYRTLAGTLDLSGYQQISLWFRTNSATVQNSLELRLCSDTLGDVPVHTIPLTENSFASNVWRAIVKDFGASLSSSIASISIYAPVDPGTPTISLDNIIACKASSDPAALTHLSLVGKNTAAEPEWYPIQSIDGTSLELGNFSDATLASSSTTPRPYMGTSETVSLYRLQPIDAVNGYANPAFYATPRLLPVSGLDGSPITISGGWDATYTNQTGVSWFTGAHNANAFLDCSNRSFIQLSKIGLAHFPNNTAGPINCNASSFGLRIQLEGVVGSYTPFGNAFGGSVYMDMGNSMANYQGPVFASNGEATVVARRISGCLTYGCVIGGVLGTVTHAFIDQIDNCGASSSYMAIVPSSTYYGKVVYHNTKLANNPYGDVLFTNGYQVLVNPLLQSTTKIVQGSVNIGDRLYFQNYNRDPNDHRTYTAWGTFFSDTTTRHAATGLAWKLSITSNTNVNSMHPGSLPLMRRRLSANVTTTISCWVRRDNTGLACGIRVLGQQLLGLGSAGTDVVASMTAAANTWEQLSLSLTPTEDGTVELLGWAYGGTTYSCWFDDITVT